MPPHIVRSLAGVLLVAALGCGGSSTNVPTRPATDTTPAPYSLVWSDEFDTPGLPDSTKWGYDVGDGCPNLCGWGNNELQYYTVRRAENARVEGGHLIIEARKEPFGSRAYTSTRLVSRRKGDWAYARVEVRADLPSGVGTWPAIWMLPTESAYGGWPASGEIDIMEYVGFAPDTVHGSVHTATYNHVKGTQRTRYIQVPNAEREFHVYSVEWTPERIEFFVDSVRYHTFGNENTGFQAWPFDRIFHVILNLAVGGNWGGQKGVATDIWPQQLRIDYVRVFQRR
ncbi:MAG TPA: glycoside hydrolase family 16 protein [Gemmatimonadaceae bacterium]|nr:glycoside hydrolase family 16 protein [Gemmatimonadaceae bacterium]